MVADGVGQVWFLGPWQLTRLDPQSGAATTWDAADDLQFASTSMVLAPATGAGVWLLDGDRIRLFDGQRFAVDLRVPGEVLNLPEGPSSEGKVTDLVQVGHDVWVSVLDSAEISDEENNRELDPGSGGQVARYSDGRWIIMAAPEDGVGGYLTVDRDGAVWAGGVTLQKSWAGAEVPVGTVRRWDGHSWTRPGLDDPDYPTAAGEVAADPTGGVWLLNADGVHHFDGSAWGSPVSGGSGLAVSSDGSAWMTDGGPVTRVSRDGATKVYGEGEVELNGLAIGADDTVIGLDSPEVLRLEGSRFTRVWMGQGSASRWARPYAVSADEVWVNVEGTWYRFRDGRWDELGAGGGSCSVIATDGALWTTVVDDTVAYPGGGQLARISPQGHRTVIDDSVECGYGAEQYAGPDGSLWAMRDGDVVQYRPDGRRTSIGRPERVDPPPDPEEYGEESAEEICFYGVDPSGSVWVGEFEDDEEDDHCYLGTWHYWNGRRWIAAESRDPFMSAREHVVAGDGIGWVLRPTETGTEIARYVDGAVQVVATTTGTALGRLTAASDGRACAFESVFQHPVFDDGVVSDAETEPPSAIVCYDADGEFARFDAAGDQLAVAPDGAVWLLGAQVARLAPPLPPD